MPQADVQGRTDADIERVRLSKPRAAVVSRLSGQIVLRVFPTMNDPLPELPVEAFHKEDAADDGLFYDPPRLVTHIDDGAIAALMEFYRAALAPGGVVLDLMSSWVSHLPPELETAEVVGHGMNAVELAANPRLTRWFVQDLNRTPVLPLREATCDAALCAVSVQYLQSPVEVFAEIVRVLRPGAQFIVSFSNRCFPTKAVAIWRALDAAGHARLVRLYMERAGFADIQVHVLADGTGGDPLTVVVGLP
jgi:Methyltransferase domain